MKFFTNIVKNGKNTRGLSFALVALVTLTACNRGQSQTDMATTVVDNTGAWTLYRGQPRGSKVTIHGDSTFHKWTMDGTMIGGSFKVPAGVVIDSSKDAIAGMTGDKLEATASATIFVRTIHSGHDIMDGLYKEALKESQYPKIEYTLTEMTLKPGHVAGQPFEFDTKGQLSFTGTTNAVSFPVQVNTTNNLMITGSYAFKMTTFGVTPPAPKILGIGGLKVADDVTITFEWALAPAAAPAAR